MFFTVIYSPGDKFGKVVGTAVLVPDTVLLKRVPPPLAEMIKADDALTSKEKDFNTQLTGMTNRDPVVAIVAADGRDVPFTKKYWLVNPTVVPPKL